jgi:hypothetical protein
MMSWEATAWAKKTRGHVSYGCKLLLLVLADYHNPERGVAWPSQATLAEDCEMPIRTVKWCLKQLELMGFITRIQRGNQYRASQYLLNFAVVQATSRAGARIAPASVGAISSREQGQLAASVGAISDLVQGQFPARGGAMAEPTNPQEPRDKERANNRQKNGTTAIIAAEAAQPVATDQVEWQQHVTPQDRENDQERTSRENQPTPTDTSKPTEYEPTWNKTLKILKEQVPAPTFTTWLKDTMLLALTDRAAKILVPSSLAVSWLEKRLYWGIVRALSNVLHQDVEVQFVTAA